MKKAIIAVLVIAIIAVGGWLVYDKVIMSPERQIVGKWQNTEATSLYYDFKEDGTVSGTIDLGVLGDMSISGTYTLDKKAGTITITYSVMSLSYNDVKNFSLGGDKLTLAGAGTDRVSTFTRVDPDETETEAQEK